MSRHRIPIRLTLVAPPAGVLFSLVDRRNRPVDAQAATGEDLVFDLEIESIGPPAEGRFVGEFVRNQSGRRFVYFAAGTLAGQAGSCWTRRGKVWFDALDAAVLAEVASSGGRLEARVHGQARDGGPACATVKLLEPWRRVPA